MRKDDRVKVLFAVSELAPYVKTGALADTASALPAALAGLGVDVRLLVPGYPQVIDGLKSRGRAAALPSLPGMPPAQLLASKHPTGVQLLVIACDIYDRPGAPYQDAAGQDWPDNALRFALLDPERLLSRALPIVRPFLGPWALATWLVVVAVALLLVMAH